MYAEKLRVSITILRIYAQFSVLEFLRIYANFIVVEMWFMSRKYPWCANQPESEFLRPYADTPNLDEKLTLVRLFLDFSEYPYGLDKIVTWADPDTHKPRRWKASSSPKVIYVAYIPTMFAKHIEQGKLIYK